MYQINAHVIPTESTSQDGQIKGAYAVLYINYVDIDGAFELAKYYIEINDWKLDELEEEYFILESSEDVEQEQLQYYNEALEFGYSLIFHCYKNDENEE